MLSRPESLRLLPERHTHGEQGREEESRAEDVRQVHRLVSGIICLNLPNPGAAEVTEVDVQPVHQAD